MYRNLHPQFAASANIVKQRVERVQNIPLLWRCLPRTSFPVYHYLNAKNSLTLFLAITPVPTLNYRIYEIRRSTGFRHMALWSEFTTCLLCLWFLFTSNMWFKIIPCHAIDAAWTKRDSICQLSRFQNILSMWNCFIFWTIS